MCPGTLLCPSSVSGVQLLCVCFRALRIVSAAEARQTCSRNVSHFMLVVTTLFSAFIILISGGSLRVREQKCDSRVRS